MDVNQYYFPVFKGLQKPLEFMGLRGRFLILAGGLCGGAFFGYILGSLFISQIVGCILAGLTVGIGYPYLRLKQKQGLHSKKRCKDILVYHYLFIRK